MCRNAFYGGLKAVEACRSLIGAFFFLLQRIDLRFLLLLLWWWFIHLLSTNKPEFLGNKNHEGAVRHLVKRVLNGEQHFRARCHSPLSAWEIKTCVFAFSSLFAVTRKKKKHGSSSLCSFFYSFFFSLSFCKCFIETHTYLRRVSLTFSFRPFSPVLSLSLKCSAFVDTHTHTQTRKNIPASKALFSTYSSPCVYLSFPLH